MEKNVNEAQINNECTILQNDKIAAGLSEKEWFHGVLPREEVVRLLVNDGDFLVRETMRHEERQVYQFTRSNGKIQFLKRFLFLRSFCQLPGQATSTLLSKPQQTVCTALRDRPLQQFRN